MNENQIEPDNNYSRIDSTANHVAQNKQIGTPAGVAFFAIVTVAYEVLIAVVAILFKPVQAAIILSILTTIIVNAIIFLLNTKLQLKITASFRKWADKKQANLNPRIAKIVEASKIGGVFLSALALGPPPTSLLIDALGFRNPFNYALATSSGILFCIAWVATYNGSVSLLKLLLKNVGPAIGLQ
jgi:hypothetical protein